MKRYIFTFLWLFFLLPLIAQEDESYNDDFDANVEEKDPCEQRIDKQLTKTFKRARSLQNDGKKDAAYTLYDEILAERPDYLEALYYYGRGIYRTIEYDDFLIKDRRKADKAIELFNQIYAVCPTYTMDYALFGAKLSYFMEKFGDAVKFAKVLIDNPDLVKNLDLLDEARMLTDRASFWNHILNNPVPFDPKPVNGISTPRDEYLATLSPDGTRFYFTRRQPEAGKKDHFSDHAEDREYFSYSDRMTNGEFGIGQPLPYPFNQSTNEGSPTLNLNNDYLIFAKMTTTSHGSSTYPNYDLYYSEFIDGQWSEPVSLGSNINSPNSWESQPSLSSDGKTLFFASDKNGSLGNSSDIWYSTRNEDGSWSKATNLGPVINTIGNERSPFLHTDSKTLYFSSSGHQGMGGLDIFYSKLDGNNQWTKPVNIGYPINSERDEVDFFVSLDGKTGYFSSNNINRDDSGNASFRDKDWNIYEFELYKEAQPANMAIIKGEVEVEDDNFEGTIVELRDTAANVIASTTVNQYTGQYAIAAEIDESRSKEIIINVKKEGYAFDTKMVSLENKKNNVVISDAEIQKVEVGKEYQLHDIYFGTNLYNLTSYSKYLINLFVEFLIDNPTVKVEIQGHTDNVGNDADNRLLSERRAKAVYDYVIDRGISPDRVRHKGFGMTKPIATNNTAEGRAKNRRTIFLIYER